MKTIILPGYSAHNKEEAENIEEYLNKRNINADIHYWKHWDGKTKFSIGQEISGIESEINDSEVNLLCKSIGTFVAANLITASKINTNKIIFCGIPINDLKDGDEEIYKEALLKLDPNQVLCIQNSDDPHGSYGQIKEFLGNINPSIKVISKEASDHNYPYYQDFIEFLS